MKIVIAGAGEVGGHAAEVLSSEGHKVTVIDLSADRLSVLSDTLDVRTLQGHCAHYEVLREAGVGEDTIHTMTVVNPLRFLAFVPRAA